MANGRRRLQTGMRTQGEMKECERTDANITLLVCIHSTELYIMIP